jgi:O-acetyl-ADP-ribose deacetylase (regulator of RNase III)
MPERTKRFYLFIKFKCPSLIPGDIFLKLLRNNLMKNIIFVEQGDITTLSVDAIVNAANRSLLGGGGVDGAIHRTAGAQLLKECRKLNGCETGDAKITLGYNLPAKFVIHTVGPVWHGGNSNEDKMLASCYKRSLEVAVENKIESVAFPSISTGAYGFPFERAARIAIKEVVRFLGSHPSIKKIIFVCFFQKDYECYTKLINEIL